MTLILESEKSLRFKNDVWKFLEEKPIFNRGYSELSMDEQRKIAVQRQFTLLPQKFAVLQDVSIDEWELRA